MTKKCNHIYSTGEMKGMIAWHPAAMKPETYRTCGLCNVKEYWPEIAAEKKTAASRKRAKKPAPIALFVMPPPSKETTKLPAGIAVHHGLCLDVLRGMAENTVDALVTDPPSGIAFMGKSWDKDKGGRDKWIAARRDEFAEALRVMKPGAYALVWALPRTAHWTTMALEDAGFEIRDVVHHLFASGYPKSLDLSKAIDKHHGAEREVVGSYQGGNASQGFISGSAGDENGQTYATITLPATPDAERFTGYGTGLKPAVEHWILCQKPRAGTFAENALAWGTGGLNIDDSRAALAHGENNAMQEPGMMGYHNHRAARPTLTLTAPRGSRKLTQGDDEAGRESHRTAYSGGMLDGIGAPSELGRWPAHVVISHSLFCTDAVCADGCPAKVMDEQSGERPVSGAAKNGRPVKSWEGEGHIFPGINKRNGVLHNDSGGASRYFNQIRPADDDQFLIGFYPKPGRGEKERGLIDMAGKTSAELTGRAQDSAGLDNPRASQRGTGAVKNFHPTVKSTALMCWLITLIAPPQAPGEAPPNILDMYAGSGTTGVACVEMGLRATLIEADMDDEGYIDLIYGRLEHAAARKRGQQGITATPGGIAA